MSMVIQPATLDDLSRFEGRAELIGGGGLLNSWLPAMLPAMWPSISSSACDYARQVKRGVAKADGTSYAIDELPSGRESFQPHVSYYDGERPKNPMRFIRGAPKFAAEVRSENDYGPSAELEMAAKRLDYIQAGTLVVWDVDPIAKEIRSYPADSCI